ncbi:hypothetical protein DUNSADRAFT_10740 [Dunaliella salina]|uniref:Pentraxin (PTX) domain-containing protein n=1 Tax=Dunaliella salina TaxID=3046 RepID=A0ABQ7GEP8_DUNSA|nr:hypothetical protein DUNSADRAFT_10740 [Dunaliella salina]|eukprot:KAF5833076.1 hypothetical protein DUNSADRAFT_10740 [Dunaliella salina]
MPCPSHKNSKSFCILLAATLLCIQLRVCQAAGASRPGGAGHALLFDDNVLLNVCTIMSYAKNSRAKEEGQRIADYNHFVIFDPRNLLACHDYKYIDLVPDIAGESCHAAYSQGPKGSAKTANFVERSGDWHHLAVTWDSNADGLTNIYMDGLLMASAVTHRTEPLVPDGAFMLGAEQDCFGGCTDPNQGFHGKMDEVRIWRTARTQKEILSTMRWITGLEQNPDLVAWWKFNEPGDSTDHGHFAMHTEALDSSGHGNNLRLIREPKSMNTRITVPGSKSTLLNTGLLQFRNNFALQKQASKMPGESFTIEFWARGGAAGDDAQQQRSANLFSYATESESTGNARTGFMDDALRIERLLSEQTPSWLEHRVSTVGAIALHINSNEHTDTEDSRSWVYFDAGWRQEKKKEKSCVGCETLLTSIQRKRIPRAKARHIPSNE